MSKGSRDRTKDKKKFDEEYGRIFSKNDGKTLLTGVRVVLHFNSSNKKENQCKTILSC